MAKHTVKVIPYDSIIDIQVSGSYYERVQYLFQSLVEKIKPENYEELVKKLNDPTNTSSITDMDEVNLITVLMLIMEIDDKAKVQNKLKDQEIDIPDDDKPVQ